MVNLVSVKEEVFKVKWAFNRACLAGDVAAARAAAKEGVSARTLLGGKTLLEKVEQGLGDQLVS